MKKKYIIAIPSNIDYNVLVYNKDNCFFTEGMPTTGMSMKKAVRFCKNSPLAVWIVEYEFPKLKNIIESSHIFENFIENCKKCGLEVIETRPSIYSPAMVSGIVSEKESVIIYDYKKIVEKEMKYGYVIKNDFGNFVNYILSEDDGFYTSNPIRDALIFRKKEEAEFQAKVLGLKTNEILTVQKINLNELER